MLPVMPTLLKPEGGGGLYPGGPIKLRVEIADFGRVFNPLKPIHRISRGDWQIGRSAALGVFSS